MGRLGSGAVASSSVDLKVESVKREKHRERQRERESQREEREGERQARRTHTSLKSGSSPEV
jgi:hypothetical protein